MNPPVKPKRVLIPAALETWGWMSFARVQGRSEAATNRVRDCLLSGDIFRKPHPFTDLRCIWLRHAGRRNELIQIYAL